MKVGFCIPNYGKATSKLAIDDSARISEKLNYDHIWTTDHLLIPEKFSYPYGKCLESLATLSYIAGKTENVELGTSIIVFPMREVILFAKQAATLQILSGNRLVLGLGAGWNEVEFQSVRADFKSRGQYYDEGIQLFRWLMKGNAEFKGDFYSISDGVFGPIPKKQIPLLFGGNGGPSLRRAAKFGDGWHPVGASPSEIESGAKKIRALSETKIRIALRIAVNFKEKTLKEREKRERSQLIGGREEIISQILDYKKAGVTDLICYFGDVDLKKINSSATKFAKEVIPSI
ncbi:MAG: TIGR03619 family F420-dependent LLM class oxidoreductase [archaeon]|nr:TIGR03619 family F420-dependent LLM class oxidoreductase [archaeon]